MKHFLTIIFCLILINGCSSGPFKKTASNKAGEIISEKDLGERWVLFLNFQDENKIYMRYYYDIESITRTKTNVAVWFSFFTVIRQPESDHIYLKKRALGRYEYNCSKRTAKLIGGTLYNDDGFENTQYLKNQSFSPIPPTTMGEALYNIVCSNKSEDKK